MSNLNNSEASLDKSAVGKCLVTCPMCGHEHTQYRLNPRMYWNTELDMDRKPSGYQYLKGAEGCYPPLYELWCCPRCFYAAHNRTFPDPLKNVFIEKGLVQRWLMEAGRDDPSFRRIRDAISSGVSMERRDFEQAVRVAMLSVFFEKVMVGFLRQGNATLARGYLRVAWLFRDWVAMDPDFEEGYARLRESLKTIADCDAELPSDEESALKYSCERFTDALKENAVANDARESAGMMLHMIRIYLQMGDANAARGHLEVCRRSAVEEQSHLNQLLQEDDRRRALSNEERTRMISDSRRFKAIIEECFDLQGAVRKLLPADGKVAQPRSVSGPKGFLRGLFSGG